MIKLAQLLPVYPLPLPDIDIGGLKLDSRQVAPGDAFVAVPGYQVDGRDYIDAAIAAGAAVVLCESDGVEVEQRGKTVLVEIPQLKEQLSRIAARFFDEPGRHLDVVGVTGTNGKTSVTYLIAELLQQLGVKAGVIGTTGSGFPGSLLPETHTTPDPIAVQQRLATLRAEGATVVAMEVSSHALVQRRVEAIPFAVGVATNISRDHLDYHGTMANYAGAKRRLFTDLSTAEAVINSDDAALSAWLPDRPDAWRFSLHPQQHPQGVYASAIHYGDTGTEFTLNVAADSGRSEYAVTSPLLGEFNVYNLLAAMITVARLGHDWQAICQAVQALHPVPGRMEAFTAPGKPLVIVDYAHTPDALQQVLTAVRRHCHGELWCLFGCGGDRDRGKRPQMGAAAAQFADRLVVTDDNPRTEEPAQILRDILTGIPQQAGVETREGRADAVRATIAKAQPNDVVVLAGKGHENYQVIGQQRVDYDERAWVAELLASQPAAGGCHDKN
ncbi:UDP-N-acetylmuramoyl-L-alanyl-D-glutamate--2, 6-diaminopimelate ligase [Pseudidiomarina piscicola]|uniref:UDP-N-acetylmuramoyl-L-alanyl-D-glutamate--2,6-diaminopimelate ligase n=1 Tax=Pseudidiomarina piscicola TaxID=2614830 RepID=A0A6S6WP50_9GAMM|nr:UDP-N-acetylmuramoyl-L-alanyl-D-glutamate--2,6-diaminopimelate ligase [Pseudidiomarina piscicola]CAB0150986.1 UDP-N-acetylmuramoyl-L-alanyl-D-glutamate--2, 6-diaminopimelate ligase [Pseudidiomarina piscicola]VZT40498.1 UDP-N-acetylmuramoyl-L-alanyl-D-glutamate--2, 6-diaminopimelate ligase [Pseudomonas aeruginosa]